MQAQELLGSRDDDDGLQMVKMPSPPRVYDQGGNGDGQVGCCYDVGFGAYMVPTYSSYRDTTDAQCDQAKRIGGATVFESKSCKVVRRKHQQEQKQTGAPLATTSVAPLVQPPAFLADGQASVDQEEAVGACADKAAMEQNLFFSNRGQADPADACGDCMEAGIASRIASDAFDDCTCECAIKMRLSLTKIEPKCCAGHETSEVCSVLRNISGALKPRMAACLGFEDVAAALGFKGSPGGASTAAERDKREAETLKAALTLASRLHEAGSAASGTLPTSASRAKAPEEFAPIADALGFDRSDKTDQSSKMSEAEYAGKLAKALKLAHNLSQVQNLIQGLIRGEAPGMPTRAKSSTISNSTWPSNSEDVSEALGFIHGSSSSEEHEANRLFHALTLANKLKETNEVLHSRPLAQATAVTQPRTRVAPPSFDDVGQALGFVDEDTPNASPEEAEARYAAKLAKNLALAQKLHLAHQMVTGANIKQAPEPATQNPLAHAQPLPTLSPYTPEGKTLRNRPTDHKSDPFTEVADALGFGHNASHQSEVEAEKNYASGLSKTLHLAKKMQEAAQLKQWSGTGDLTAPQKKLGQDFTDVAHALGFISNSTNDEEAEATYTRMITGGLKLADKLSDIASAVHGDVANAKEDAKARPPAFSQPPVLQPAPAAPTAAQTPAPAPRGPGYTQKPAKDSVLLAGWLSFKAAGVSASQVQRATQDALALAFHVPGAAVHVQMATYRRLPDAFEPAGLPFLRHLRDMWSPTYTVAVPLMQVFSVKKRARDLNGDPTAFAPLLRNALEDVGAVAAASGFVMKSFGRMTKVDELEENPGGLRGVSAGQEQVHVLGAAVAALLCCLCGAGLMASCRRPRSPPADGRGPDYQQVDESRPPSSSEPPHYCVCVCFGRSFTLF